MNSLHNPVPHEDGSAAAEAVPHSRYRQGLRLLVSGRINLGSVGEVAAFQLQGKSKDVTEQLTVIPVKGCLLTALSVPRSTSFFTVN